MTRRTMLLSFVIVVSVTGLDACRKKPEAAPSPAGMSAADLARLRTDSITAADAMRRRADSIAAASRNSGPPTPVTNAEAERLRGELVAALSQKIYFDYDQDALRDETRSALDTKAAILGANGGISLIITGHTDERGTAEYNLALGQRRAAQVKRYLMSKNIPENRLTTQSLGDAQPASQGTDEASYQQNRRAEFEPQNATGMLVRPRP